MARPMNEDNSVGKRIGQLMRQYDLRIAYAEGKCYLYGEEAQKADALKDRERSLRAHVAANVWDTYRKNLSVIRERLQKTVLNALAGYSETQRRVWWLYFIENRSCADISEDPRVKTELRSVYRIVAFMRDELELRFKIPPQKAESQEEAKWSAKDLARFLEERPSEDYIAAVKDLLDYGIVDLDLLEFDPNFQDYVRKEGT